MWKVVVEGGGGGGDGCAAGMRAIGKLVYAIYSLRWVREGAETGLVCFRDPVCWIRGCSPSES